MEFDTKILVEHIDSFGKGLSEWEVNFIANLKDHPPVKYSDKQRQIVERIYYEKC